MSTVAICDYDGANNLYKEMLQLAAEGRAQWQAIHGSKLESNTHSADSNGSEGVVKL